MLPVSGTNTKGSTVAVHAEDVAVYILKKHGPMSAMKLQKLVYYAQAWSLVWDEKPLFSEQVQAWVNGPVVRELYAKHATKFGVDVTVFKDGKAERLDPTQQETVDEVLKFYGDKTAQWLSDLTHKELPWRRARIGVGEWDNSDNEITLESMAEYYTRVAEKQAEKTSA